MAKDLNDLISKLEKLNNNLAEEIAPEVNKLLKESVNFSLVDWYNDYDPKVYKRTNNFMRSSNSAKTTGEGNTLIMSVDSSPMSDYPGFWGQTLDADAAFDFFFMNGEHGHGKYMMHQSLPPYMAIENDISDGFGGRIDDIITKKINEALK